MDSSAESIIEEPVKDSKTQTMKGRPKGRASSMSLLQGPRRADPRMQKKDGGINSVKERGRRIFEQFLSLGFL